ncbi:hypothetical protein QE364_000735 [Nocardioides zeae]|uniref:Uncharacterized protein n=1 Tax=Nocardioides zeae TaxID=1457234 RepID=A0ACC6IE48_9ACTN|nr:hypothetical protein [Nocardioides zeae]MDR6209043.1 hypothetical protein [Nocardioides zeae]
MHDDVVPVDAGGVRDNRGMQTWRTTTRLPLAVDALAADEADPAVARLVAAFGGAPASVEEERLVGEPPRRSRRLRFASGGEILLQDGIVAAVTLHVVPVPGVPRGLDLTAWLGAGDDTLDVLRAALGTRRGFGGFGTPYFVLGEAYARCDYRDRRGWNESGNLLALTVSLEQPGRNHQPDTDFCPTCGDLLVRGPGDALDLEATVGTLAAAVADGRLREDPSWVPLSDVLPLATSGLMERVEAHLTCTTCATVLCLTLPRGGAPAVARTSLDRAQRRPMGPVPPVEEWGDEARVAAARDAMHYVDHEPGAWFLVEERGVLLFDARYVVGSMADDSALVRLDEGELAAYRAGGHDYLTALARRIHDGSPHREDSVFRGRDLYRGPDAERLRAEVSAAIRDHTWLAAQRRG